MKNILLSYWLWTAILIAFITIILWDDQLDKSSSSYVKHRMVLKDVNFSQVEGGFEYARLYADFCDMDDNQNNINASNVRSIFYKQDQATFTGYLLSDRALKNPFEAKFWGDVRGWNTDNERIKTEEMHYFLNRKELHTQKPVTIWKDDAILTGLGLRYNTVDKEAQIHQQVVIRIWETGSKTAKIAPETEPITALPIAPPLSQILLPLNSLIEALTPDAHSSPDQETTVSEAESLPPTDNSPKNSASKEPSP